MARVKTFVAGGDITVADLNAIQDDYDSRLGVLESLRTNGAFWAPGDIKASARTTAALGWLLCDGVGVTTAYPDLRAALIADGSPHGTDGSGNPKVPDLRGRVPVGVDGTAGRLAANDALGQAGGTENHTLTSAQIPAHTHPDTIGFASHAFALAGSGSAISSTLIDKGAAFLAPTASAWSSVSGAHTKSGSVGANTGGGGSHPNMQPFLIVNFMIKT